MSRKENAYEFWERVDKLNTEKLNVFCEKVGLDYNKVKHNRSDVRYMSCTETLTIAKGLGTTVEFLLTGSGPETHADDVYAYMEEKMPSLLEDIERQIRLKRDVGLLSAQ